MRAAEPTPQASPCCRPQDDSLVGSNQFPGDERICLLPGDEATRRTFSISENKSLAGENTPTVVVVVGGLQLISTTFDRPQPTRAHLCLKRRFEMKLIVLSALISPGWTFALSKSVGHPQTQTTFRASSLSTVETNSTHSNIMIIKDETHSQLSGFTESMFVVSKTVDIFVADKNVYKMAAWLLGWFVCLFNTCKTNEEITVKTGSHHHSSLAGPQPRPPPSPSLLSPNPL